MPSTLIGVRRRYSQAEESGIMAAVHEALASCFAIPPEDRHLRLVATSLIGSWCHHIESTPIG